VAPRPSPKVAAAIAMIAAVALFPLAMQLADLASPSYPPPQPPLPSLTPAAKATLEKLARNEEVTEEERERLYGERKKIQRAHE